MKAQVSSTERLPQVKKGRPKQISKIPDGVRMHTNEVLFSKPFDSEEEEEEDNWNGQQRKNLFENAAVIFA